MTSSVRPCLTGKGRKFLLIFPATKTIKERAGVQIVLKVISLSYKLTFRTQWWRLTFAETCVQNVKQRDFYNFIHIIFAKLIIIIIIIFLFFSWAHCKGRNESPSRRICFHLLSSWRKSLVSLLFKKNHVTFQICKNFVCACLVYVTCMSNTPWSLKVKRFKSLKYYFLYQNDEYSHRKTYKDFLSKFETSIFRLLLPYFLYCSSLSADMNLIYLHVSIFQNNTSENFIVIKKKQIFLMDESCKILLLKIIFLWIYFMSDI